MSSPDDRRLTVVQAAVALIAVLLIVQMWLLAATLEAYLAGHDRAALPGAIVSAALFGACLAIERLASRLER